MKTTPWYAGRKKAAGTKGRRQGPKRDQEQIFPCTSQRVISIPMDHRYPCLPSPPLARGLRGRYLSHYPSNSKATQPLRPPSRAYRARGTPYSYISSFCVHISYPSASSYPFFSGCPFSPPFFYLWMVPGKPTPALLPSISTHPFARNHQALPFELTTSRSPSGEKRRAPCSSATPLGAYAHPSALRCGTRSNVTLFNFQTSP